MGANDNQPPAACWSAQVLTLFPEAFPGVLGLSLAGRALRQRLWSLEAINIRDYAADRHGTVDDTPFGGGPGMVMRADILAAALDAALAQGPVGPPQRRVLYLSPRGRLLDQRFVRGLAEASMVTLICGRFEGVDERVLETRNIEEVSVGDLVLAGGEPAAFVVLDATIRLLPGVLGNPHGLTEESFAQDLLEYPHYTRPQIWESKNVPDVLLSGHHDAVRRWRQARAEEITKERRPDLWRRHITRHKAGVEL
ncbi:MAG: tRNA (guanosine(37)-N1)-methyltransferase TrmD [Alphaproteobacteria bacterium]|nr:tRNA (guanosine(37)-N1)-methyltransferase TrmD [Alphaproteobacteria bacterium]